MYFLAVFSTHILFLLFLLSVCVHYILISKFNFQSVMRNYIIIITTHLVLGLNFLLPSFDFSYDLKENDEEISSISHYKSKDESGEAVECAVCLCKLEEGDEIRELQCDHLFHKVCLDRWIGYRNSTCPLCRGSLIQPGRVAELVEEVKLLIKFSSFQSSDRNSWWLR
ncbi:unnamed protein product [Ilex paraguariensis]|uniref:RING-type domain-containing protein n=1 Tax=Ilex paraguariensis TaxID=185542 RepID=A0ABC8RXK9_9AQUA